MATASLTERFRLLGLVGGRILRNVVAFLQYGPFLQWRLGGGSNGTLLFAPQDLRTSDPTIAADIYSGRFALSGQVVETPGRSVFRINPPSPEWAQALHTFSWLRHLRSSDSALASTNAKALVMDWIETHSTWSDQAWEPEATARRVIVWLSQSPMILKDADHATYSAFVKSVTRQVRYLRQIAGRSEPGLPRLKIAIALCFASLAISSQRKFIRSSQRRLDAELEKQILNDGGHVSRDPSALIDILADMLPLRQTYTAEGSGATDVMQRCIDRMIPMLRFFRHGDGNFAHFNGTGATQTDLIATILAYDDARGQPLSNATFSGYQRVTAGSACLIMDTGTPPPIQYSSLAHAGCLSFEFSSGRQQIIVNCGAPSHHNKDWQHIARSTAAHSTITVGDTSSCSFASAPGLPGGNTKAITSGPRNVPLGREDRQDRTIIRASHDGYSTRYNLTHDREITVDSSGQFLLARDIIRRPKSEKSERTSFTARFHLHPAIKAARSEGGTILLTLPDGTGWQFTAENMDTMLEESVYLSGLTGPRRTMQIVINSTVGHETIIDWSLQNLSAENPRQTRPSTPESETAQLPLETGQGDSQDQSST
ncbi:heparinase II/III family protein [Coralliovum pocilloporae]|uniref:heparinase II/III family protein n=1 Tax=Coralliovum pocilloporae TaxID=3066369 RepID=UPI003306E257